MASAAKKHRDWIPTGYDLRDTWFPIAHSTDITEKAVRRIVHSQTYFLWRDSSQVKAAEIHPETLNATNKSASEFTGGSYHYPVCEQYGYIWVWYGNPDNADHALLPHIPFLPKNGDIPKNMRATIRFDACSALSVENLIDLTHADFLHGELIGGEGESESDEITFDYTSETLTRVRMVVGKPVAPVMKWIGGVRAKHQEFRSTLHVHLRSGFCISYPRFRPGFDIPNTQSFVPSGSHRSRVEQIFGLADAPFIFKRILPKIAYKVGPQDNYVMRPQNPRYLDPSPVADMHSRFDAPGNRYQFLMQSLHERQQKGDFSYGADVDPGGDITEILGMEKSLN